MVDAPSPLRRSARGATIHAAAGVAQLVEHQLPKLRVVGSSPIARFTKKPREARLFVRDSALCFTAP